MIHLVPAILAVGCIAALLLARGQAGAFVIAQMLCGVWAGAMLLWFHNALWAMPLLDLSVGIASVHFWVRTGKSWALTIAIITLLRLGAHVIDWFTHSALFVGYAHALNALFALQLIIIASTGGADGRRRFISWLRRLRSMGGLGPSRAPGVTRAWK